MSDEQKIVRISRCGTWFSQTISQERHGRFTIYTLMYQSYPLKYVILNYIELSRDGEDRQYSTGSPHQSSEI